MRQSLWSRLALAHHEFPHRRDPAVEIGSLEITGNPISGVPLIGMFVIVWSALPVAGLFVVAAVGLGAIYGAAGWVRRG